MNIHTISKRSQRGVVLVISLLLLLVLTLIGVAATRSTTLEERMTANQHDQEVAFQAAEAALRDGESVLQGATPGQFNNTNGMYTTAPDYTLAATWDPTQTNSVAYSGTNAAEWNTTPRYYIVETSQTAAATGQTLAADSASVNSTIYSVIARGVGLSGNSVVVLESDYRR